VIERSKTLPQCMDALGANRGHPYRLLAALVLAASFLLLGAPAHAVEDEPTVHHTRARVDLPGAQGDSRAAQREALLDYWTPERMRATEAAAGKTLRGPV
jgi:hypothetical protein